MLRRSVAFLLLHADDGHSERKRGERSAFERGNPNAVAISIVASGHRCEKPGCIHGIAAA